MASPRRRVPAVAVVAVLAFSGCGDGGDEPDPPDDRSSPAGTSSPANEQIGAPEFPPDPQTYAEVTVAAWAAPDLLRLSELTTSEVHDQIVELSGPPDLHWSFIRCAEDDQAASSECSFYNADGDQLALTVEHELLGEPRATTAMAFSVTEYPARPLVYVEAFVSAWSDGNQPRMLNLAVPAVSDVYAELVTPSGPDPVAEVETDLDRTDGGIVEVLVTVGDEQVRTELSTDLLGEPQAIRAATLRQG